MEFLCIERNACDKTGENNNKKGMNFRLLKLTLQHRIEGLRPFLHTIGVGLQDMVKQKQAKSQMCIYIQEYKPLHLYGKRKQVQNINKLLHSILLCETNIILSN
jgi:hypothetical protein